MKNNIEYMFSEMPVTKVIVNLALPAIISQLITLIYNIVDTFFIGQLNKPQQVAAITLAMPFFVLLTANANLFGIGGASVISRQLGVNNRKGANYTSLFCIQASIICTLIYSVFLQLCNNDIINILCINEDIVIYFHRYLFWTVVIGGIPTVLNAEFAHLIRSEGYSKEASIGVAFGGILNIMLDPILIFSFHMEITGAAVATMLSNICATIYYLVFIMKIRFLTVRQISLFDKKHRNIAKMVITAGMPSAIMILMSTISNMVLNRLVAGYAIEAVAGMGIAKKIDSISYQIAQGFSQGTLPLIGFNYAANKHERMKKIVNQLLRISVSVSVIITIILFFTSNSIMRVFISDAITVTYGGKFLRVICLACPTTAMNFVLISIFQAIGARIQPLFLSFLRKGTLDVPLMILLNHFFGVNGIAYATPAADLLALVIAMFLYHRYFLYMQNQVNVKNAQI